MGSWNELLNEFLSQPDQDRAAWHTSHLNAALCEVGKLRGDRNVILYGSAFLQKPSVPGNNLMITHEDLNGLMSVMHKMDYEKGLTLILHTPGGITNAAESVVAYLRTKFDYIEVVVPALAMSAGTMLSLAADKVVMGRQSQLGPIDPQMTVGPAGNISARAVVEQFERARKEVAADRDLAHLWAPIVQSLGPALLQQAQNELDYSERMVANWLTAGMLRNTGDPAAEGRRVAHHFNDASSHKSHGRRIDRDEARQQGVLVDDLEDSQELQEAVLTVYHLMTIAFETSLSTKTLSGHQGFTWSKSWTGSIT